MSRSRVVAVLVLVVVALVVGALVVRGTGSDSATDEKASSASSSGSTGSDPDESGAGFGSSEDGETGEGGSSDDGGDGSGDSSGDDGRASELAPVEEADEAAGKSTGGLPGLTKVDTGPIVAEPLPPTASRRGGLVAGYPARALPVPPGATVRSSSVSRSSSALQVAVDAGARNSCDAVARFHRVQLARYGFKETPVPAVGGSTGIGFQRGQDSLVLTLTPRGKGACDYTLFGTLHPAKA